MELYNLRTTGSLCCSSFINAWKNNLLPLLFLLPLVQLNLDFLNYLFDNGLFSFSLAEVYDSFFLDSVIFLEYLNLLLLSGDESSKFLHLSVARLYLIFVILLFFCVNASQNEVPGLVDFDFVS